MLKCAAVASVVSLIAATALATPTSAAVFVSSTPSSSVIATGTLQIDQGGIVECNVSLNGYILSDGSMMQITDGSFTSGDWQCGWLVQPASFPWTVVPSNFGGGPKATIYWMGMNTILGHCGGTLTFDWSNSYWGGSIDFWAKSLSGSPSTCYLNGRLSVTDNMLVPITIQ